MGVAVINKSDKRKLRVVLVQPFGFETKNVLPLALAYQKANLDSAICEVTIIDCALRGIKAESREFRELLKASDADVVAVSSWSPMILEALGVLRVSKEVNPATITVIGGNHASTYYGEVMKSPEVDYLFRGEAEVIFCDFIRQIRDDELRPDTLDGLVYRDTSGALVTSSNMPWIDDLDSVAVPDYRAIDLTGYIEKGYRYSTLSKLNAPLWLTRGCPYRCQFCAAPQLNGKKIRTHSIDYVMKMMTDLYDMGVRHFNIINDNFTFHARYAKDICKAIINANFYGITMATPNGIRLQKGDPELWQLMYQAGWRRVVIAPESGSSHILDLMQKDLDLAIVPGVVKDMQQAGLIVFSFFLIGYPGERPEDLMLTRKLILDVGFDFFTFHLFQPLPGTPAFDKMVASGDIPANFLPGDTLSSDSLVFSKELDGFNVRRFLAVTYVLSWLRHFRRFLNFIRKVGWRMPLARMLELVGNKKRGIELVPETRHLFEAPEN